MTLITQVKRPRKKTVGQTVVLLPEQAPDKETFTDWRNENAIDDKSRVYLPFKDKDALTPHSLKKNKGLLSVAYNLASGINEELNNGSSMYFSSKKLRSNLGMTTKKSDLSLHRDNRSITRLSVISPELSGKSGAALLDEIVGHYLTWEKGNPTHIVATKNLSSKYTVGLGVWPFSEHSNKYTSLEATVRMDKEGFGADLTTSIPFLATDIMEVQVYNAEAVKRYNFVDFTK